MLTSGDFSENSVAGRWDIFYYDEADTIPAAYANEERFSGWEISKPVELWSSGWVELDSDENGPRSRWNDAKNPGTHIDRVSRSGGGEKDSTSINQTVAVATGNDYELSFDFKGRRGQGIGVDRSQNHQQLGNDAVKWVNMYNPSDRATNFAWRANNLAKGTTVQDIGIWDWSYDYFEQVILLPDSSGFFNPGLWRFVPGSLVSQRTDITALNTSLLATGTNPGKNAYEALAFLAQSDTKAVGNKELLRWFQTNADTRGLVNFLIRHYRFEPQTPRVAGEQLFQMKYQGLVVSELRTYPKPVLWATSPHNSFSIDLELNRPGTNRYVTHRPKPLAGVAPPERSAQEKLFGTEPAGQPVFPAEGVVPSTDAAQAEAKADKKSEEQAPKLKKVKAPVLRWPG